MVARLARVAFPQTIHGALICLVTKMNSCMRDRNGRILQKLGPEFPLTFLTAQMSVLMVFCGPHLPLAFQFVCGPGGGGAANKLEGKWKVSFCLVAPPQAAAEYGINSSFC